MTAPVLYYLPPSPPCRSILLLAKMLGLEFELKIVNILEGEQLKPEFVAMNPQHCLPTMNDEGLVLWESRAILSYLVAAYGKSDELYPTDIRVRALVDQRLQFDLGTLYQRLTDYYFPTMFIGAPLDEGKRARLTEAVGWLNAILEGREFAAADHFTIADLTLLVTVSQLEAFGLELKPYKHVRAWLERCKEHMTPYDYEELNGSKAILLADMFKAKMNLSTPST
ncbi:LOW QUALITY PROTEIN: glutathione S-transferase D7 [Drosophila sulfurigaster albostrigata]|uniref:LOW QUALITY PROTEIN: glutathione S-transferase D7 n=1 Tax=Drosophila sulfurigaster albostrigata TaxID=89887 RepID=UPI002D21D919|nr:LOW QUALITY PROTEIN: glutathione S-transferase D7 [Drosophila sulfurigaster albostrigata]